MGQEEMNGVRHTGAADSEEVVRGRDYQRGCPEPQIKILVPQGL